MIDKIWFDWQNRDPANAHSFSGGSVQALESLDTYNQYPTGGPPFLSVSVGHLEMENSNLICSRS
jgi:tyrosinase